MLTRAAENFDKESAAALLKNPALVNMIQSKLSGLVGQSSGYVENLPADVRKRVAGLKGVQKEHAKLESQFQEEVLQLEKKYFAKFTPLYQKRAQIVVGKAEPTEEEIAAGEEDDEEDEDEEDDEEEGAPTKKDADEPTEPVKGIPEFWLSAMKNQPSLADLITERDEDAMKELIDIRMEYLDRPGFKLIFEFADNDFFTNKTLTKTYYYQEENGYGGDFIYDHADGEKVDWKSGKDLTVTVEQKKQRNKSTSLSYSHFTISTNRLPRHQANPHRQEDRPHRLLLQLLLPTQASHRRRRRRRLRHRGAIRARLHPRRGHQGEADPPCHRLVHRRGVAARGTLWRRS